jgi:flagellar biosynthesis protein FlhB
MSTTPFLRPDDKVKVTFFATSTGQIFVASLMLAVALFAFVASCIAVNLSHSLDEVQPSKQKATLGTGWTNIFLMLGAVAGASAWLYYSVKAPRVDVDFDPLKVPP